MARVGDAVVYAGGMTQPWRENETAWYLRPENKGVAAVGSKVVAIGGGDWDRQVGGAFAPRMVSRVEVLDFRQLDQGWRQPAAFPGGPCVAAMVAAVGGKIYHFGGYALWYEQGQRHIEVKNTASIYDVAANRWEPLPALPRRMYGGACTVLRDRYIVLMGGVVEDDAGRREMSVIVDPKRKVVLGQYSTSVLIYDTANRSYKWSRTPMPRGHNDIRAAVLDEKIYVVGGENADVTLSNTTSDVVIAEIE